MTRLPNFIYIGPDKAGSSWLHDVLIEHPQVFMTPAKDLYFFDRYFDKGTDWYAAHFEKAGDQYTLRQIWTGGDLGREFRLSRREVDRRAAGAFHVDRIVISAQ